LNFTLGTLDVLGRLDLQLRLSEQEGSARVIASPRVVTLHNQQASISQTVQIPILTTRIEPSGAQTTSIDFRNVSLNLEVTPLVTNDGSIIMQVNVTRQSLGAKADPSDPQAPINSSEARTRVIVKSSQTAVIGGIYQDTNTLVENRTPWLGQMPFLSWLFRASERKVSRSELLVFLTPRILGRLENVHGKTENVNGVF
jgi:type IV pilus assembly protein PilQ